MRKFNIGEKVKIISNLIEYYNEPSKRSRYFMNPDMLNYAGVRTVIKEIETYNDDAYRVDADQRCYFWCEELLEKTNKNSKYLKD